MGFLMRTGTLVSALTMCWSWALWVNTQKVQALSTLQPLTNNCTLRLETHGHHCRGNGLPATNETGLPTIATGPFCPRSWALKEMKPVGLGKASSFTQGYYVRSSSHLQRIEEYTSNWVTEQVTSDNSQIIADQRKDCFARNNSSPIIYTVTEEWNKRNMCFHPAKFFCYF